MISEGIVLADRYEILSRIGTGGMSDVYKAQDMKLSRFVAIKVLKQEYAENQNFVTKFHAEAQAAAGLIHSNIVGVYDVGEDHDLQYIVMELVEGITLKHYIEKKLRLSVKESISIAIQMAQGLECAHKAGIIHRDVKPQNVIISKDGKVKVTDFGIAKAATSETITSNVMGSVHYTSPEQARGGYSDEKSDIYSLGIVLFEMLTGRVPFDGDTTVNIAIQHIQDPMPSPREFVNDVPVSIEQIIFKCTEKSSDRRYSSMSEVIADLKQSLLTPDENFIKRIPSGGAGGSTRMVTEEDMRSIKSRTGIIDVEESLISAYNRNKERRVEEPEEERPRKRRAQEAAEGGLEEERHRRRPREEEGRNDFEEEELRRKRREAAARKRREQQERRSSDRNGDPRRNQRNRSGRSRTQDERARRNPARKSSSAKRSDRYRNDEDMDDRMTMIMRIIAVIIGIIILLLIVFIARRVIAVRDGGTESQTVSDNQVLQDMRGKSFEDAKKALEEQGFVVQTSYESSDSVEQGLVISQDPVAGSRIPTGYTVVLQVSSGTGNIEVPDLTGNPSAEAKVALENLGLAIQLTEGKSDTVPQGSIVSQTPEAGTMVAPGSTVLVVVSTGSTGQKTEEEAETIPDDKTAIPNLIGLTEQEAKAALASSSLTLGSVAQENSATVAEGRVISQSIEPDTLVAKDTKVTVIISKGPEQATQIFSQNVQAPSGYTDGSAASITLTGNNSGKVYGQQSVTSFPVTIQISSTDVDASDTAGVFTIVYTARVEGVNEDGSAFTTDQQTTDASQSISFAR